MDNDEDFLKLASEAGLPTTEAEIDAKFSEMVDAADLVITNESAFGPFWRFVSAAATKPVKWLVDFVALYVLAQAFVKTASGPFLELHAWAVALTRKTAIEAEGVIAFTRTDSVGTLTVPAETVIQSQTINGQVYSLQVIADIEIADGVLTFDIAIKALATGIAYNLGTDLYNVLPEAVAGIASVTNSADWLNVPGADLETDDELRDRVRNQYAAINQWHTDAVYTSIIASFESVTVENVYFEHDAPRGPGTANAFVMLEIGNPSQAFIDSIQSEITDQGNHGHGDDLQVFIMPESLHDLTASVLPEDNLTAAQIVILLADVENFIRGAFRENTDHPLTETRPWSVFSFSRLAQEMHDNIDYLKNVAFNLYTIESEMDIPRINSLTVTESV